MQRTTETIYRSDFIPFHHPVSLDTKINFGKHKGLTLKRICEIDTGWINWAMENLKMFLDSWAFDYLIECEQMEFNNRYGIVKPIISNRQFIKACERIEKGEIEVIEKVKGYFSLEPTQEKLLDMYLQTKHLRDGSTNTK